MHRFVTPGSVMITLRLARRHFARQHGAQRGQTIVEFALLLPILVLIGMVALGGAQLLGEAISMRNWGREGVLAAAAFVANPANNGATQAQLNAYVQQRVTTVGASPNVAVTVSPIPSGGSCSDQGSQSGICLMAVTLTETMYPVQNFFGGIRVQYTATAAVP